MNKIVSAVLLCALLASMASCSDGSDKGSSNTETTSSSNSDVQTTAAESETAEDYDPDLPDVKYENYNFRMLTNDYSAMTWSFSTMDVEELTGEPINDAIYNRNQLIEEKYGITLTEITVNEWMTLDDIALKSIQSGEDAYDIIIDDTRNVPALITQNMLHEVSNVPYIDINDPWWDENVNKEMAIGGKTYFLAGDYCLAHYDATCALFFNKNMLNDLGLTSPYDYIKEDKWTFDTFGGMLKNVSADLDGNSKFDKNDQYAISSLSFALFPQMMTAAEEYSVSLDKDNVPFINAGSERYISIAQQLDTMFNNDNILFEAIKNGEAHQTSTDMFVEGRVLFFSQLLSNYTYMREMEDDYGIIPYPKYDENQENYSTLVFGPPLTAIPITNKNLERTGVILDDMAAESIDTLIPSYYEITLLGKAARDEESIEMLELLFDTRCYDLATCYWWDMVYGLSEQMASGNGQLTSYIEKNRNIYEKQITEFYDAMVGNN